MLLLSRFERRTFGISFDALSGCEPVSGQYFFFFKSGSLVGFVYVSERQNCKSLVE
jgi:hypothetical protein